MKVFQNSTNNSIKIVFQVDYRDGCRNQLSELVAVLVTWTPSFSIAFLDVVKFKEIQMKIAAKFTGFSFALFAILLLSSATSAQEGKGKGGGQKGKGSARQRGGEKGPQRGGRAAQNPVKMVEEMIARFDKDGDKKLDAKELVAMFTEMRQSRGARGGAGAPGGAGQGERGGKRGGPEQRGGPGQRGGRQAKGGGN